MFRVGFLVAIMIGFQTAKAQWMLINENGGSPDASAALEIQSTDRGVLIPRMTESQKNTISNPKEGLLLYQTNQDTGFYFFDGSSWQALSSIITNLVTAGNSNFLVHDVTLPIPIPHRGEILYVHPTENSSAIRFLTSGGLSSNDWSDGESNTANLVASHGQNAAAAYLCDTLAAFGFSDWYLPSASEAIAIELNANLFPGGLMPNGLSGTNFWTSTVTSTGNAPHYIRFHPGRPLIGTISNEFRCFCVRKSAEFP